MTPLNLAAFAAAAVAEIAGCFAFWAWWRLDKSPLWLAPGVVSLIVFAWLLALTPVGAAGRAYAVYGGVYIAASLLWLWAVEGVPPDRFDLAGAAICTVGAGHHPSGAQAGLTFPPVYPLCSRGC